MHLLADENIPLPVVTALRTDPGAKSLRRRGGRRDRAPPRKRGRFAAVVSSNEAAPPYRGWSLAEERSAGAVSGVGPCR